MSVGGGQALHADGDEPRLARIGVENYHSSG